MSAAKWPGSHCFAVPYAAPGATTSSGALHPSIRAPSSARFLDSRGRNADARLERPIRHAELVDKMLVIDTLMA